MQDGYDQTLSGLIRKRAELAMEVTSARTEWEKWVASLDAIDAAIRVFRPDLPMEDMPERQAVPMFGSATSDTRRFLLDLMRNGKPMRATDGCAALMEARGLDQRDRVVVTLIRKRVTDAFCRMRARGLVTSRKLGSGSEVEWRLA